MDVKKSALLGIANQLPAQQKRRVVTETEIDKHNSLWINPAMKTIQWSEAK